MFSWIIHPLYIWIYCWILCSNRFVDSNIYEIYYIINRAFYIFGKRIQVNCWSNIALLIIAFYNTIFIFSKVLTPCKSSFWESSKLFSRCYFSRTTLKWSGREDLFEILFSFPLDIYPEVGLLDHTAVLCLIFWGIAVLFSIAAVPLYGRGSSWPSSCSMPEPGPERQ